MSSYSFSKSFPSDVAVLESSDNSDEDTNLVVREIRQLPLPSVPTVLAQDRTAEALQPVHSAPATSTVVPALPRPNPTIPTPSIPASSDTHVTHVSLQPASLSTPRAVADAAGTLHSLLFSPSSSSSGTSADERKCREGNGVFIASAEPAAPPVLSVPPSPSPAPTAASLHFLSQPPSSALKLSVSSHKSSTTVSSSAAGTASQFVPSLAPVLTVPLPIAAATTRLSEVPNPSARKTIDAPYAVTSLVPPTQAISTKPGDADGAPPASAAAVALRLPQLVSAFNVVTGAVESAPSPPLLPPPVAPTATALLPAAAASTPAVKKGSDEKRQHLRRTRDALEKGDFALFTSPDADRYSSHSEFSSSDDEDEAYVGRTRRIGTAASSQKRKEQAGWEGNAVEAAAKHDASHAHRHHKEKMVIKMREVEGKGDSVPSPKEMSPSSQSTNALTPDNAAQAPRNRASASTSPPHEECGAALIASCAASDSDNNILLTFTSPVARFAALCMAGTKNTRPNGSDSHSLTQRSLFGYGRKHKIEPIDATIEEDVDEGSEKSDPAIAGTVHFRFTGAFSDATNDSKVPSFASHEMVDNKHRRTQKIGRGPAEAADSIESAAAGTAVLALTIRGMSPLHTDVGVVHPFVRIWLVSCATGRSLVQASAVVPCAVTQPFDIRAHKTRTPWWDAKVALRLSTEQLYSTVSDAMLLFEVVDFGNETIHGFPLLRSGLYPICWGFLMLRDCAGRSTIASAETVHVQMFRYPQRTPWYLSWLETLLPSSWSSAAAQLQPYDLNTVLGERLSLSNSLNGVTDVPRIYHIFKYHFNRKIPYEGGMVVTVRRHRDPNYVPDTTDMLPYEEYLLSMLVSGGGSCAVPRSTRAVSRERINDTGTEDSSGRTSRGHLASSVPASPWAPPTENYYRMDGERSLLPHEILQKTAVMGIVTCVCFAHNGTLFALGVYRDLQYLVELRNPLLPDMPVVATLLGHTGHLHRVVFQKEDRYLLSCASDGTVRVWQPRHTNCPFSADTCSGPSSVQCVCTLPHGFPVYTAIFHQEKIIAGGFSDQLFVWVYERPLEGDLPSVAATDDSALHLTATFMPELQLTPNDNTISRPMRVLLGELIYRVDNAGVLREGDEPTITLSLASNERSNRVWSVHANGVVVCWRAVGESTEGTARTGDAGRNWQMSVRHTTECDGASEVQVSGSYAIVVCGHAPLVFVYDATTCEQLRVVNTRLPPATPVSLLADGEVFVGAVGDPSRLVAWECFDGGLCTTPTGYAQASPLYSVARMSWAESQQLSIMVSRSPCTEEDMLRFIRGPSAPAPGQSAAAYYFAKQAEQYRLQNIPSEMTLLTVAGTARKRGTVIQVGGGRAAEAFCVMFGGDLKSKRKTEYLAERAKASRQRETERDSRRARLRQEAMMPDPSSSFATTATAVPYDATEKGARMNAIINFWRGLVGQHKRGAEDLQRVDAHAATETQPPPQNFTHRALQYLDGDGNEGEV